MSKPLVIVESPTKVKTISKILENNYKVCSLILDLSASYEKLVRKKKAA